MRTIPIRNRRKEVIAEAIVDDSDFERFGHLTWSLRNGYAARSGPRGGRRGVSSGQPGRQQSILLHREILGAVVGVEIDHKNRNRLDCRRDNLRITDRATNARNRSKTNGSGYIGITLDDRWARPKWRASIGVDCEVIHLGTFATAVAAALAFDEAKDRLHGVGIGERNFPMVQP